MPLLSTFGSRNTATPRMSSYVPSDRLSDSVPSTFRHGPSS